MPSIFSKDPASEEPPSNLDRIGSEIAHLKKGSGSSTRHGNAAARGRTATFGVGLFVFVLLGLYSMDPILHAWYKESAIRIYLYMHNYDSANATDALVASKIFSSDEIQTLNRRPGSFSNYFASAEEAERKAAGIVRYIDSQNALRAGEYNKLDYLGKVRYFVFIRSGLVPPTDWTWLDPSVN